MLFSGGVCFSWKRIEFWILKIEETEEYLYNKGYSSEFKRFESWDDGRRGLIASKIFKISKKQYERSNGKIVRIERVILHW